MSVFVVGLPAFNCITLGWLHSVFERECPSWCTLLSMSGSVAEWLLGLCSNCSLDTVGQTVHTHCASVHQAAKFVVALLRVAGVTAGLAESNGSLPPGLWVASPAGWLPRTGISSGTQRSVIEYGLPFTYRGHCVMPYDLVAIYCVQQLLLLLLHPFNGLFSRTTWVRWYQKGKTSWI